MKIKILLKNLCLWTFKDNKCCLTHAHKHTLINTQTNEESVILGHKVYIIVTKDLTETTFKT